MRRLLSLSALLTCGVLCSLAVPSCAQNKQGSTADEERVSSFLALRGRLDGEPTLAQGVPPRLLTTIRQPVMTDSEIMSVLAEPPLHQILSSLQGDTTVRRVRFLDDIGSFETPPGCAIFSSQPLLHSEYSYSSYPAWVFVQHGGFLYTVVVNDALVPEGIFALVNQPSSTPDWARAKRRILAWLVARYGVELVPKSVLAFVDESAKIQEAAKYCNGSRETVCRCQLDYFGTLCGQSTQHRVEKRPFFFLRPYPTIHATCPPWQDAPFRENLF